MSTRSVQLRSRVKEESALQSSEDVNDASIDTWVAEAIRKHCPQYTSDNLPVSEEEAVTVLAQIQLCYRRASAHVNAPDASGGNNLGAQRESVYTRNIRMAESLVARYGRIVGDNSAEGANTVMQGRLYKQSAVTDRAEGAPDIVASIVLASSGLLSTEVVLTMTADWRNDFNDFYIFVSESGGNLEEWNMEGNSDIPRISASSTLLLEISDQHFKSFKAEELTPNTEYYFIAVMWTARDQYIYSNDLRVMTPAS